MKHLKFTKKIFLVLALIMFIQPLVFENYTEANSPRVSESVSAIEGNSEYTLLVDASTYRGAKQVGNGTPPREKGHVAKVRYFVGDTTGRTFFCIEPGIMESAREYNYIGSFNSMYSNSEVEKFIAYAMYNNIDKLSIQLGVWNILGYASIPSKEQAIVNSFREQYRKNPQSKLFEGATVYVLDASVNAQHRQRLITFDYERPIKFSITKVDKDGNSITTDTAGFRIWWDQAKTKPFGLTGSAGDYSFKSGVNSNTFYTKESTGVAEIIGVPKGSVVYIEEIKAPDGYNRVTEVRRYDLTENNRISFNRTWRNDKDTFTLRKVDENGKLITGQATGFELYTDSAFTKPFTIQGSRGEYTYVSGGSSNTVYTNANTGILRISEVPDGSIIYAKETQTPVGHKTTTNQLKFDLRTQGVINHTREVSNERIKIEIAKVDENNKFITSSQTTFRIFKDKAMTQPIYVTGSAGKYEYDGLTNKSNNQLDVLTIPNKGIAELRGFPAGVYYVKENKAPFGYNLKEGVLSVEGWNHTDSRVALVNTKTAEDPQKMRFTLQKSDVVEGEVSPNATLQGAKYQIKVVEIFAQNSTLKQGDVVRTIRTNQRGIANSGDLELGIYDVVETKESNGYALNPVAVRVEGRNDGTNGVYTRNVVQTSTNKKALVELLNQKITELNKLSGKTNKVYEVNDGIVNQAKDNVVVNTYELKEYGRFEILKMENNDKLSSSSQHSQNKPEEGIEFEIYKDNQLVETIVTNKAGRAYSNYYPTGTTLRIRQKTATATHEKVDDFEITIEDNFSNLLIEKDNIVKTRPLQIVKKDAETKQIILKEGVKFKLYEADKQTKVEHFDTNGNVIPFVTDKTGIIDLPSELKLGKYFLKEIEAAEGYFLDPNGEMIEVNITEDLNQVVVEVENIPQKARLVIEKTALILVGTKVENGETIPVFEEGYLAGTRWQLTAKEDIYSKDTQTLIHKKGAVVKDGTTQNRPLEFTNLALGKYELKEVSTDENYVLDTKVEEIEFVSANQEIRVVSKTTRKVNERKNIEFEIVKEFEDSTIFERNPKATFGLYLKEEYKENGITIPKDTLLDTITLDTKDVAVETTIEESEELVEVERIKRTVKGSFENQLIDGLFYVKEISTDDDYVLDNKNHEVEFSFKDTDQKDNKVVTEVENKLNRITLRVVKVEMGSNNEIVVEGARYRLVAVDEVKGNTVIGEYITNHLGELNIEALENGKYYLEEVSTTNDYFLNEEKVDVDLTESKDGEVVEKIVENERKPEIKTTAKDNNTGKKQINPIQVVEIKDIVSYKDLIVGKKYTISGRLMDKLTNSPLLDKDGNEVTSEITFVADRRNGEKELIFTIDASLLRGKEIVVFEKLFRENRELAIHEDINDEGQTVRVTNPSIGTTLATVDGLKEVFGNYKVTLVDKVEYKDLVVGKEYTLELVLMNKATGEPLVINGEIAKVTKTFIAQTKDGVVDVEIEVDLSMFKGTEVVAFEKLFYEGIEIATHEDINDEGQTISVVAPELPLTGSERLTRNIFIASSVMTTVFLVYIINKKREEVKG